METTPTVSSVTRTRIASEFRTIDPGRHYTLDGGLTVAVQRGDNKWLYPLLIADVAGERVYVPIARGIAAELLKKQRDHVTEVYEFHRRSA